MQSLGVFENYDGLCDCLEESFMHTATASISEEEEGAVLYLVQRSKESKSDKVLSLTKTKTLEYRLFRKMREKLRNNVASDNPKKDFGLLQKRFMAECKSLCAPNKNVDFFSKLPRPF